MLILHCSNFRFPTGWHPRSLAEVVQDCTNLMTKMNGLQNP